MTQPLYSAVCFDFKFFINFFSAPSPHPSSTGRNGPSTPSVTRPEHPGVDTTGDTDPAFSDIRPDRNSRDTSRQLSRQSSRASIKPELPLATSITNEEGRTLSNVDESYKDIGNEKTNEGVPEIDQNYTEGYENYEQTADNTQYEHGNENVPYETPQYDQSQGYEQNFEQGYADGQYENYEQYPQQYNDPNAQYQGEYENYGTENYQGDQNYDNTQYNQEYTPEYQEPPNVEPPNVEPPNAETQNVAPLSVEPENVEPQSNVPDSKINNSPNEKVTRS